jgi:hypothetical protein
MKSSAQWVFFCMNAIEKNVQYYKEDVPFCPWKFKILLGKSIDEHEEVG